MNIKFVRTRHVYDSYCDFWRLVEASKFDTCFVDEIDLREEWACYIFTPMNGEVVPFLEAQKIKRSRVVWWNLERPGQDPTTSASIDKLRGLIHAIWVSDQRAAQDPRFTYVFMASHEDLGTRSKDRVYDICTLAYLWGRRRECIDQLKKRGLSIAPAAYGRWSQDEIVARSRLMLNLHQYADAPFVAPLRFAVAAAYAIPLVSERLAIAQPGPSFEASLTEIPDNIEALLAYESADELNTRGFLLHHRFCIHTNFRHEVEQAVNRLARGITC